MIERSATEVQKGSTDVTIDLTPFSPPTGSMKRVLAGILGQKKRTRTCPDMPRLEGKRVLVTGGAAGVGELIARGAEVTTLARGKSQGSGLLDGVKRLSADLADPESIIKAVDSLDDQPFDLLICNSGLLAQKEEFMKTGFEKTFAVNVLGHHLLYRLLIERGLLAKDARIVMTTGDIYRMDDECSPYIPFDSTPKTYARSKLGNLWQVSILAERSPDLHPIAVHPGVIASGFSGAKTGFLAWLRSQFLISEQQGAQSALIAATQNLPRGSYWHNVFGLVNLAEDDPALNHRAAKKLWDQLEEITEPFLNNSE